MSSASSDSSDAVGKVPASPVTGRTQLPPGLPEELPPVEPPSAGYIIQLFLIPALIVCALAAVVFLFGRLGDAESDWKQMVSELGSSNEHRRWRAAQGLSQLLWNDEIAVAEGQLPLAEQPVVIDGLAGLLRTSLESRSVTDEDIRHQQFLARALGALRNDEKVMPVLALAMAPEVSPEVRKSAAMSVAAISGRHFEEATGYRSDSDLSPPGGGSGQKSPATLPLAQPTISNPEVLKQLRLMAQDSDPALRHIAAFTTASVSGPDCISQLKVILLDADAKTRANAAVGLARNGSTEGAAVLLDLLASSYQPYEPGKTSASGDGQSDRIQAEKLAQAQHEVEQATIARSCLRAIEDLWSKLSTNQRQDFRNVIVIVAEKHPAADVRLHAARVLEEHPAD